VTQSEIRVTLLGVKRLSQEEYRQWTAGRQAADWGGGGLQLAFHVENRPGAPMPPVLGEVRVLFGGTLYNPVTNATSSKPFAPDISIFGADQFFGGHGRALQRLAPTPRPGVLASVLDVYVRGGPIARRTDGVAEMELGESYVADPGGGVRQADMSRVRYLWFRFALPPLD
jgi:hypothetical protein